MNFHAAMQQATKGRFITNDLFSSWEASIVWCDMEGQLWRYDMLSELIPHPWEPDARDRESIDWSVVPAWTAVGMLHQRVDAFS